MVTERTYTFLKASLRKLISNHNTDWGEIAHTAAMDNNVFPHSAAGEAPLYLIFGHDAFMPTLFKLLLPKLRYMGDKDAKWT